MLKGDISNEVKAKIVADAIFTEADVSLLKSLAEQNDDILAFQSLKTLSKVNSKEAYAISQKILPNYNSKSILKVSAAQKSTVQYLKDNKIVNRDSFMTSCLQIINNTQDASLKDSSVFALSGLNDEQSIIKIIQNNSIDTESKMFSIDQNFLTLNQILLNKPSEEAIQAVVTAMEILPIKDLIEPLENVKKDINDKNLEERCNDVLAKMKLEGIKGNVKSLDKNNNNNNGGE